MTILQDGKVITGPERKLAQAKLTQLQLDLEKALRQPSQHAFPAEAAGATEDRCEFVDSTFADTPALYLSLASMHVLGAT